MAPDYHVEVDDHYYSVPFRLLRETVDVRFTDATVEVFHKGQRVASHVRSRLKHKHTTTPEHMPSSHRRYAEWSPARMLREAGKIGPATTALFEAIMKAKPHPEQGFRSCLGILSLRQELRPGAHRGGGQARQRHRRHHLRLDQVDPAERPRPRLRAEPSGGRCADPARQHPRPWLLPLSRS